MINKLQLELRIELLLSDIKSYTDSAWYCLTDTIPDLDKEEIIMYVETIPEIIDEIRELLNELG